MVLYRVINVDETWYDKIWPFYTKDMKQVVSVFITPRKTVRNMNSKSPNCSMQGWLKNILEVDSFQHTPAKCLWFCVFFRVLGDDDPPKKLRDNCAVSSGTGVHMLFAAKTAKTHESLCCLNLKCRNQLNMLRSWDVFGEKYKHPFQLLGRVGPD